MECHNSNFVPGLVSLAIKYSGGSSVFFPENYVSRKGASSKTSQDVSKETLDSWLKNGRIDSETNRQVQENIKKRKYLLSKTKELRIAQLQELKARSCRDRAYRLDGEDQLMRSRRLAGACDGLSSVPLVRFKEIQRRILNCFNKEDSDIPLHLQIVFGLLTGVSGAVVFLWVCSRLFPSKWHEAANIISRGKFLANSSN